ncbi:MAG: riboflavin synthase [Nitrospirae bacterium]|nr:riboflavin synthase [Nitrospirota bacterium]
MFTGIVKSMGEVVGLKKNYGVTELAVRDASVATATTIGDSIAVSGVCLTVVRITGDVVFFDVSQETMKTTDMASVTAGKRVNLEPAMSGSSLFGGHFVTGHVDGVGTIKEKRRDGDYTAIVVEAGDDVTRYVVRKGSITIDGVSLTVVDLCNGGFTVGLIPHTASVTTLGRKGRGDRVNLEADIIGKYVEKFVVRQTGINPGVGRGVDARGSYGTQEGLITKLKEEGYMK